MSARHYPQDFAGLLGFRATGNLTAVSKGKGIQGACGNTAPLPTIRSSWEDAVARTHCMVVIGLSGEEKPNAVLQWLPIAIAGHRLRVRAWWHNCFHFVSIVRLECALQLQLIAINQFQLHFNPLITPQVSNSDERLRMQG